MLRAALPLFVLISIAGCTSEATDFDYGSSPKSTSSSSHNAVTKLELPAHLALGSAQLKQNGWYPDTENQEATLNLNGEETAQYLVREGRIKGVDLRLNRNDPIDIDSAYQTLFTRLENTYGQAQPTKHFATWKAGDSNGKLIEVSLINGKELYAQAWVEVQWRAHENRRYAD